MVLQHPQEDDFVLGTAPLLEQALASCEVRVGLSWRSLAHALGARSVARGSVGEDSRDRTEAEDHCSEDAPSLADAEYASPAGMGSAADPTGQDPGSWAVLYPSKVAVPAGAEGQSAWVFDKRGELISEPGRIEGIVVLDGTWSQAKTLWWRNPWLLKLSRIVLRPNEPSIYGKARREPSRAHVSTLEAVADALVALGEPAETRTQLRRAMRTMVQRARDSGVLATK